MPAYKKRKVQKEEECSIDETDEWFKVKQHSMESNKSKPQQEVEQFEPTVSERSFSQPVQDDDSEQESEAALVVSEETPTGSDNEVQESTSASAQQPDVTTPVTTQQSLDPQYTPQRGIYVHPIPMPQYFLPVHNMPYLNNQEQQASHNIPHNILFQNFPFENSHAIPMATTFRMPPLYDEVTHILQQTNMHTSCYEYMMYARQLFNRQAILAHAEFARQMLNTFGSDHQKTISAIEMFATAMKFAVIEEDVSQLNSYINKPKNLGSTSNPQSSSETPLGIYNSSLSIYNRISRQGIIPARISASVEDIRIPN